MSDELERLIVGRRERVERFLESLREQGLHVGVGPKPARCVTCDEPWPCAAAAVAETLP